MPNLGPACAEWLSEIGIHTKEDLERVTPVVAYKEVVAMGYKPTLNFLYAMVASLLDLKWNELPEDMKRQLKEQVL